MFGGTSVLIIGPLRLYNYRDIAPRVEDAWFAVPFRLFNRVRASHTLVQSDAYL